MTQNVKEFNKFMRQAKAMQEAVRNTYKNWPTCRCGAEYRIDTFMGRRVVLSCSKLICSDTLTLDIDAIR